MLYGIRRTAVSVRAGSARAPCAVCISQLRCFIEPQPLICWRRSTHVLAILRDSPSRKIVFISSSPIEKNLRFTSISAVVRIYAPFSGGLAVKKLQVVDYWEFWAKCWSWCWSWFFKILCSWELSLKLCILVLVPEFCFEDFSLKKTIRRSILDGFRQDSKSGLRSGKGCSEVCVFWRWPCWYF